MQKQTKVQNSQKRMILSALVLKYTNEKSLLKSNAKDDKAGILKTAPASNARVCQKKCSRQNGNFLSKIHKKENFQFTFSQTSFVFPSSFDKRNDEILFNVDDEEFMVDIDGAALIISCRMNTHP